MAEELFGTLEVESVDRTNLRIIVADRVKFLKTGFKSIPAEIDKDIAKIADRLQKRWTIKNRTFLAEAKRERADQRLIRWKVWAKEFRLIGLLELSKNWYGKLRKLRSEVALITAMYEFSEIDAISAKKQTFIIKDLTELKPLSLRLRAPRVQKSTSSATKALNNSVKTVIEEFLKPISDEIIKSRYSKRFDRYLNRNLEILTKKYKEELEISQKHEDFDRNLLLRRYQIIAVKDLVKSWNKQLKQLKLPLNLRNDLSNLEARNLTNSKGEMDKGVIKKGGLKVLKFQRASTIKKATFSIRDIKFNLESEFLMMLKPLVDYANDTLERINKLIAPKKKLALKTKIKRYKDTLIVREYLTVVCQAVAPRQSDLNRYTYSNGNEEKSP